MLEDISNMDAALSEKIDFGGSLANEQDAKDKLSSYKSIIYLAMDEGADMGFPGGFQALKQLEGHDDVRMIHFPVDIEHLTLNKADKLQVLLEDSPRPTYLMCKSGKRASAVKALFIAHKANLGPDDVQQSKALQEGNWLSNLYLKDWVLASLTRTRYPEPLIFRPLYEETSWTYSYILACPVTREAVIIDPVDLTVDRDIQVLNEMGVKLKYAINTHCHADHITGSGLLSQKVSGCQSVIAEASGARAQVKINHGDRLKFGERMIECRSTPGHTNGCMSFLTDDYRMIFTGDALLIRACGRTDFQAGDASKLFDSIHTQIFTLPEETVVYPGHDYKGRLFTTIGEEKTYNPRLVGKSQAEFIKIMDNLKLAYPKKIDQSLPANLVDGLVV